MDYFSHGVAIRFLEVALCAAIGYLLISLAIQVVALVVGSGHRRFPVPRSIRFLAVSLVALVATPKPAAASNGTIGNSGNSEIDDTRLSLEEMLFAASMGANVTFGAILLRRRLVDLRSLKFGQFEGDESTEPPVELNLRLSTESRDWLIVVRVLGPPAIEDRSGRRINFSKGKAQELVVWMTEHRQTSTRSGARTALWDGNVQDSTFSNVVSEARRALNSAIPLDDDEWIPRTFSDDLPLHPAVVTDAELLANATDQFLRDPEQSVGTLSGALCAVGNLPFSGANYPWADGEGITTSHVMKVVKAAVVLGEYAIENDDTDLLFMATERGLRVLPGHEELVALRMKGHARLGNRSAIKFEWESYARAIEADSWAGAVPSQDLQSLATSLSARSGCQDDI